MLNIFDKDKMIFSEMSKFWGNKRRLASILSINFRNNLRLRHFFHFLLISHAGKRLEFQIDSQIPSFNCWVKGQWKRTKSRFAWAFDHSFHFVSERADSQLFQDMLWIWCWKHGLPFVIVSASFYLNVHRDSSLILFKS